MGTPSTIGNSLWQLGLVHCSTPSTICPATSLETDPICNGNSRVRSNSLQTGQTGRSVSKCVVRNGRLAPDHDCCTAWTDNSSYRAWNRPDACGVAGHVVQSGSRQPTDHYGRGTLGNQSGATRHTTRQHARPGHVSDSGGRCTADKHVGLTFDDAQRQRWMGHWGWDRRRRVDRSMTMGRTLQNIVSDAGRWHSHVNRFSSC